MTQAIGRQVGGTHYMTMPIQPIEFATVNAYDPCAFSILKYISRHRRKNGAEDLAKALHFVDLRLDLLAKTEIDHSYSLIPVTEYCEKNLLRDEDRAILVNLHDWVRGMSGVSDSHAARTLRDQIHTLAQVTYNEDLK